MSQATKLPPTERRNILAVERLNRAMLAATDGQLQVVAESVDLKRFSIHIDRLPKYGPPLPVRKLSAVDHRSLDIVSVFLEAIAEARR